MSELNEERVREIAREEIARYMAKQARRDFARFLALNDETIKDSQNSRKSVPKPCKRSAHVCLNLENAGSGS